MCRGIQLTEAGFLPRPDIAIGIWPHALNNKDLYIASIYLEDGLEIPSQALKRLVKVVKDKKCHLLAMVDANAHNTAWGSKKTNTRGKAFFEFLVKTGKTGITLDKAEYVENPLLHPC